MVMNKEEVIKTIIEKLEPSINKVLSQTPAEHREDLRQDLYEKIIRKVNQEDFDEVPGFFDLLDS